MIQRIALTVFTALFCGLFQQSFSQVNYQPGYVVSHRGDTLSGFIDYRNWEKNPEKIMFREKADGVSREYSPLSVRLFSVAGDLYAGAIVKVENSPERVSELGYSAEFAISADTVFLRTLISGPKRLYLYTDNRAKEHFYIGQDSGFELLLYKRYVRDNGSGSKVITESKTFIGQLKVYLGGGCAAVEKRRPRTSYDRNALERLFAAYYECAGTAMKSNKKTDRKPAELGLIAGVTLTTLSLQGDERQILMGTSYPSSVNFTGGLFYDLPLRRNRGKWSLNNELVYTAYQADNNYVYLYEGESRYQYFETKFKYSHLKLNIMPRYKYPVGKLFLFVDAGLSIGAAIQEEQFRRYTNKFGSTFHVEEGDAFDKTEKLEFGYLAGGGLKFKRYSFEVRYSHTGGMVSTTGIGSSVSRFFFLVGYRLK